MTAPNQAYELRLKKLRSDLIFIEKATEATPTRLREIAHNALELDDQLSGLKHGKNFHSSMSS